MLEKLMKFAGEYDMLPESGLVLACVSGGADSMCLLAALLEISARYGFAVGVMHYNHMLRHEEAQRDEDFVKDFCALRGVKFYAGRGDVREYARVNGLGIEEAARNMRYAFFNETARRENAARIATAHTADDNAETVIMNLSRGAGLAGLLGIPPVRESIIRPMLRVTRVEVIEFLAKRGLTYMNDSTNESEIYTRNMVRKSVIPVLKGINPRFCESVSSMTELLREDENLLASLADSFIKENCDDGNSVEAAKVARLPRAVSSRVIRRLGSGLTRGHVESVLRLCGNDTGASARLSLPGITVYRQFGRLTFEAESTLPDGFPPYYPGDGMSAVIPGLQIHVSCRLIECGGTIHKSLTTFLFKYIDLCGRIVIRPRLEGDFLKITGREVTKTLKKLYIENRIPARLRPLVPVIADDMGVLAVYGIGAGERAAVKPGDLAFEIKFEGGLGL